MVKYPKGVKNIREPFEKEEKAGKFGARQLEISVSFGKMKNIPRLNSKKINDSYLPINTGNHLPVFFFTTISKYGDLTARNIKSIAEKIITFALPAKNRS